MGLWQDLRFATRLLMKDRWFTLAAVIALALGIGANNVVFTIVNAVLYRGAPFNEPDRVIALGSRDARGRNLGISHPEFEDLRTGLRSVSSLTFMVMPSMNVSDEGRVPEQYSGAYVSVGLFRMFDQHAVVGRDFRPEDELPGAAPVVMLGSSIWKSRYGGDPAVLGRTIKVNEIPATVIGVMPEGMRFPPNTDLWVPVGQWAQAVGPERNRTARFYVVLGRLEDGVTLEQAQAEVATASMNLQREYPKESKDVTLNVTTFNQRMAGPQLRLMFLALLGAVAFVLLIACANVANLLLARAAHRAREVSVRFSLGATRWRVVRQLLVESLLLSAISGVAGFGLSLIGIRLFDAATQGLNKPYYMEFTIDPRVFAAFTAVCLATGIIFGLAPALHISKTNVNEVLKEGGRSGSAGMRARRWTGALIIAELTLTLVLLAGAGYMMRSFLVLYRTDVGIQTSNLLTMWMQMPARKYITPEDRAAFLQRVEERLGAISAIEAGTTVSNPPMGGFAPRQLLVDGKPSTGERLPSVSMISIGPRYFDTVNVRLARGRTFTDSDGLPGYETAIVNQRFVAMHFPGEDPVGRRIKLKDEFGNLPDSAWTTIIGIAPTIRQRSPQNPENDPSPDPVVYVPHRVNPQRRAVLLIRTRGNPGAVTPIIREEVRALDPDMPLFQVRSLDEALAQNRWFSAIFGSMFVIFAIIALVLSAVGLYAVTAYSVTQRTQEIGVRMALGAQPTQVWWLVVRQGLVRLAVGLVVGLAGAVATGRLLRSVTIQTGPADPAILGAIAMLLIAVALTACFLPARRATRLNPTTALRYE